MRYLAMPSRPAREQKRAAANIYRNMTQVGPVVFRKSWELGSDRIREVDAAVVVRVGCLEARGGRRRRAPPGNAGSGVTDSAAVHVAPWSSEKKSTAAQTYKKPSGPNARLVGNTMSVVNRVLVNPSGGLGSARMATGTLRNTARCIKARAVGFMFLDSFGSSVDRSRAGREGIARKQVRSEVEAAPLRRRCRRGAAREEVGEEVDRIREVDPAVVV